MKGTEDIRVFHAPDGVYEVENLTKGTVYTVREVRAGCFICTCPAFIYRPGDCKHIVAVQATRPVRTSRASELYADECDTTAVIAARKQVA